MSRGGSSSLKSLMQFLGAHWAAILPWAYMGLTAFFVTMPQKGTRFDGQALYGWIYDAVHQFANLSTQAQRPTLPGESPANPKQQ